MLCNRPSFLLPVYRLSGRSLLSSQGEGKQATTHVVNYSLRVSTPNDKMFSCGGGSLRGVPERGRTVPGCRCGWAALLCVQHNHGGRTNDEALQPDGQDPGEARLETDQVGYVVHEIFPCNIVCLTISRLAMPSKELSVHRSKH